MWLHSLVARHALQLNLSCLLFLGSEDAVHAQNAFWAVSDWVFFWGGGGGVSGGGSLILLKQAFAHLSKLMSRLDRTNAEPPPHQSESSSLPNTSALSAFPVFLGIACGTHSTDSVMEGTVFQACAFCSLLPGKNETGLGT